MDYCALSIDGGVYDSVAVNSLSILSLSLAVQGGAHSASKYLAGISQSAGMAVHIWKVLTFADNLYPKYL